jgi:glycerate 2-kinase
MVEVCGERFDASSTQIFAVALGKAAAAMAHGVEDSLGDKLTRGVISAPAFSEPLSRPWEIFEGGHPLPNEASIEAAEAALNLLDWANDVRGVVICLVSGGGSAMFEYPKSPSISLDDLRRENELLIAGGARICEINEARRKLSSVKGGQLVQYAPDARFVSLIVSDTNRGDEANVASGPTLPSNSPYQVLLGNWTALEAAHKKAVELGFTPSIAHEICEQPIQDGCDLLLAAMKNTDCLISGGEFSCPVRGRGLGGRNLETVLRVAMDLDTQAVAMSAGTDGIDGNSPAAGAIADQTTVARARRVGLDPADYLARSDSYTFFQQLGDEIVTGPTGTNVRDLRIFIRSS